VRGRPATPRQAQSSRTRRRSRLSGFRRPRRDRPRDLQDVPKYARGRDRRARAGAAHDERRGGVALRGECDEVVAALQLGKGVVGGEAAGKVLQRKGWGGSKWLGWAEEGVTT
jgi:hypothetical protein